MSSPYPVQRGGNTSRIILWIVIALLVVLGLVGQFYAVRGNPYQSYPDVNGVSRYQFIEACKGDIGSQIKPPYKVEFSPPVQLHEEVQSVPGGGWLWNGLFAVRNTPQGTARFQFQCAHDKKTNKTQIVGVAPLQGAPQ